MSSDKHDLLEVLDFASDLLGDVGQQRLKFLPPHLQDPAKAAWPGVQARLREARQVLDSRWDELRPSLDEAGLTGDQLALKMAGFRHARSSWLSRRLKRLLLGILKWLNIFLGSLGDVLRKLVPGFEAVKEYKESLEHGLEEKQE